MVDEDRRQQITEAVDHLIQPGEAWVIRKDEVGMEITRTGQSSLAVSDPELYGRLLQLSERLNGAGGSMCIWGPLVVLVFCLGFHLHWFDTLLGAAVEKLRSVWFYGLAVVVSFFLFGSLAHMWERFRYNQSREAFLRAIDQAGLTPHRLITVIEGDESLHHLADQLKADPHIV